MFDLGVLTIAINWLTSKPVGIQLAIILVIISFIAVGLFYFYARETEGGFRSRKKQ